MPKVSVLMPTYNVGSYLSVAIESILSQTFTDFELIIIDDCSTDSTFFIASDYAKKDSRIKLISNDRNYGICISLNKGIEQAQGEYIVRMDGDDYSYPTRIKQQVDYMDNNLDLVVSGACIEVCDQKLKIKNKRNYNFTDDSIRKNLFKYSPFAHPATIWRTKQVKACGGYSNSFVVAQDYDLYFRIGKIGKFGNLQSTLLKLRTHNSSSSGTKAILQEINTLYIRLKAVYEYGYKMSFSDKLYFAFQTIGLFLIPTKIKFGLFNFVRKFI